MAAAPFDSSRPAASLFDIFNDTTASPAPGLPCGGCNFVDLTPGANGAKCGCRRFWLRQAVGSPALDQWCMCSHHACFHDQASHGPQSPDLLALGPAVGQENEKPRQAREPLSPVLGVPADSPSLLPAADPSTFAPAAPLSFARDLPDDIDRLIAPKATPHRNPPASMPDTLPWCDFSPLLAPDMAGLLPPIPAQCLMPSQAASTTSSYQARYLRPFAGKGLQTLSAAAQGRPRAASEQPGDSGAASPARPRRGDSCASAASRDADATASRPGTVTQAEPRPLGPQGGLAALDAVGHLTQAVSDHGHRLDKLETVSFNDDCHDRWDNFDVRMTELESRVEEVEKLANDNASVAHVRGSRDADGATASTVSASSNITAITAQASAHSQEIMSHIYSLQAQVSQLRSFLPSFDSAWEVEVVFLPFPLKRLWQDIHHFKPDSRPVSDDDWAQLPMTHSTAARRSQSPFFNDWAVAEHDAEWLLPRACGNASVVDKRLRSRGLVRRLSVRAPDYRSVQAAVYLAFGSVFRQMQMRPRTQASDPRLAQLLGLQQCWVPLRKIHKDSRLRFLSPAEMMTPALWDVPFLNSVMMRSTEPRLFLTHPNAYLQDMQAYETGWTWQRLRELTRVYPDPTEPHEVPEADALEECWAWSEHLDEAPGAHTSMGMRSGQARASAPLLVVQRRPWRRSMSPVVARGHSPLLARRRDSLPPQMRTASVPVVVQARASPPASRRRVVSHGQGRRSTPSVNAVSQAGVSKRRRRTRSPCHHRHHHRFTPRWTASPSPMPPGRGDRQGPRGTTPSAYATPYSNAPLQELRLVRSSSVARTAIDEGDFALADMGAYESDSGESYVDGAADDDYDDDGSVTSEEIVAHAQLMRDSQQWQLPEDEPWPGIEDQDRPSDGENLDPHAAAGGHESDASSQPSEYPSTSRAWPAGGAAAFDIHEDVN